MKKLDLEGNANHPLENNYGKIGIKHFFYFYKTFDPLCVRVYVFPSHTSCYLSTTSAIAE